MMKRVSDIDLRLLRIFVAVAEARGFAAAEAYLNVSTSTISVHISNLEKRLGLRLCERGRGGFKLTDRGAVVFRETKKILKSLDDFTGVLASTKSVLGGRLSIGMVDGLMTHPRFSISEALREFNSVENDVEIELVVAPRQTLEHDVVNEHLHAAIGPFIRNRSGLVFSSLFDETHGVYCGKGHPLYGAGKDSLRTVDLAQFPAVVRQYHHEFDRDTLGVVKEVARVDTMEGMLALLLSGGYIGFLPDHYASPWVAQGGLFQVGGNGADYVSRHAIVTKSGNRETLALESFVTLLMSHTK